MDKLHPGTRWIFRLRGFSSFFGLIIFFIILSAQGSILLKDFGYESFLSTIVLTTFSIIILTFIFSEIFARMTYNRYLYDITKEGLKIEQGIIWKKYTSLPYERVQNVNISRGIIARIFGFSTIDIETAGQSGWGRHKKRYKGEGHIPGVDIKHAEEIRKFVMHKITSKKTNGGV